MPTAHRYTGRCYDRPHGDAYRSWRRAHSVAFLNSVELMEGKFVKTFDVRLSGFPANVLQRGCRKWPESSKGIKHEFRNSGRNDLDHEADRLGA